MKQKKFKWRKNTELPDNDAVGDYIVALIYECNRWILINGFFDKVKNSNEYGIFLHSKDKEPYILWRCVCKWCYDSELINYIK